MAALRKNFALNLAMCLLREDLRLWSARLRNAGKEEFPELWELVASLVNELHLLSFASPGKGAFSCPDETEWGDTPKNALSRLSGN
jgi:hypothetical protein